ncbi:CobW family GTP-binding protein [Marinomonas epiphytica]
MANKIPVTVLTGFLGSGKTTLLNRILSEEHGLRIAVIENEFGEIGIDQDLVINADEEIFEMNNGCICCTIRGDLVRILCDLAERKDKFDRVILETTGMANPGPVAQTFFVDPDVGRQFELDGIITLVDSKHVDQHLDEETDEVMTQVAFADRIIMNKADLVSQSDLQKLSSRLQKINQMAGLYQTTLADAPIPELLDIGGFNLQRALEMKANFLEPEYPFEWGGTWLLKAGDFRLQLENGPDPDMKLLVHELDDSSPRNLLELAESVYVAFSNQGQSLSHSEAITEYGSCYRLQLEGQTSYSFDLKNDQSKTIAIFSQHTPEEFNMSLLDASGTALTCLGQHYFNPDHHHHDAVTSVAIELPGSFDVSRINAWIEMFIMEKGEDIYRMKGVFAVHGEKHRILFQGVHMMFGGIPGKPWGDEPPCSKMVFIGKNLDENYLRNALNACLYTEQ